MALVFLLFVPLAAQALEIPSLTTQEKLGELRGLKIEPYEVQTDDGYLLAVYRIPGKDPNKLPVLLVHGLLCSSEIFTIGNKSLAEDISQNGNEIWLANLRGNVHSRKHITLSPKDAKFWDISIEDISMHDIPALVDFVLAKSGKPQLHYVGHSLGSTVMFVLASRESKYDNKVRTFSALGPVASCKKYSFLLAEGSLLESAFNNFSIIMANKNKFEAFPRKDVEKADTQIQCIDSLPEYVNFCEMGLDMASSVLGPFAPAGTSFKLIQHFHQCVKTGNLSSYDYGKEENIKVYKQETAPEYDLKKIKIPTNLFFAHFDQAIDESDIAHIKNEVTTLEKIYKIEDEFFSHVDYVFASNEDVAEEHDKLVKELLDVLNMK